MNYAKHFVSKMSLKQELIRFSVKLIFSLIMILLLMYLDFYWSFFALISLFFVGSLFSAFCNNKKNKFVDFIKSVEVDYNKGFPGKEILLSLLAFIVTFLVIWVVGKYLVFNKEWIAIIGFIVLGIGNNLVSLILFFKNKQFVVFGTTLEFFILSLVINVLILWFLGVPLFMGTYLILGLNLLFILPWLDHNLTVVLLIFIFYMFLAL